MCTNLCEKVAQVDVCHKDVATIFWSPSRLCCGPQPAAAAAADTHLLPVGRSSILLDGIEHPPRGNTPEIHVQQKVSAGIIHIAVGQQNTPTQSHTVDTNKKDAHHTGRTTY